MRGDRPDLRTRVTARSRHIRRSVFGGLQKNRRPRLADSRPPQSSPGARRSARARRFTPATHRDSSHRRRDSTVSAPQLGLTDTFNQKARVHLKKGFGFAPPHRTPKGKSEGGTLFIDGKERAKKKKKKGAGVGWLKCVPPTSTRVFHIGSADESPSAHCKRDQLDEVKVQSALRNWGSSR